MFTGLVQAVGVIRSATPTSAGLRLLVDPAGWSHRPELGESVAVSGCCLTLGACVDQTDGLFAFDVIPETLSKTTLGALTGRLQEAPPSTPRPTRHRPPRVNLERSLSASDLLGGHLVQGHVDGVGRVLSVDTSDGWRVRIGPPPALMPYITPKGSVCVDGVSLTIAALGGGPGDGGKADAGLGWFEVALIPTTLDKTTLADLVPGDAVNIEADTIVKTIVHVMTTYAPLVRGAASTTPGASP